MELHTTTFERALHLLLFVAGGVAIAVAGLAALERLTEGRRTIRILHVAVSAAVFVMLFVAERAYHAVR